MRTHKMWKSFTLLDRGRGYASSWKPLTAVEVREVLGRNAAGVERASFCLMWKIRDEMERLLIEAATRRRYPPVVSGA